MARRASGRQGRRGARASRQYRDPWLTRRGLALASILLAGGGDGTRGNLPDHIKTVTVPIFKNRTLEPGTERAITSGVVNAFSSGGVMLWRREGLQETSDFQVEGSVSDTVALAVDRF